MGYTASCQCSIGSINAKAGHRKLVSFCHHGMVHDIVLTTIDLHTIVGVGVSALDGTLLSALRIRVMDTLGGGQQLEGL